jgi:type IV pilus assembly protein PilW
MGVMPRQEAERGACAGMRVGRIEAGFTLVELLVAMLLGLFLILGVGSLFLTGQRNFRTSNALADVADSTRVAFELMSRDIRGAADTGCDSTSGRLANVLNNQSVAWWANWDNAVHGYAGSQADPAIGTGTDVGDRVAGTDSLQIIGASGPAVTVQSSSPGAIVLNAGTTINSGDIVIVCSPDHATVAQVSSVTGASTSSATLSIPAGGASPGNYSQGLGFPAGNSYTFLPNSLVSGYAASDWYIGRNPVGGNSLYRVTTVNGGGGTSAQALEIARNVVNMQITYLQPPGTAYVTADAVTNWGQVVAANVMLTVASTDQRASVDGSAPLVRTYSATSTVRNRVN